MGKIILEFDSIEEKDEARFAIEGANWYTVVWDFDQYLRAITKYGVFENKATTDKEINMAEKIREKLREIVNDYDLTV